MKDDALTGDASMNTAWSERLEGFPDRDLSSTARPYVEANIEMIEKALRGEGPDGPSADGGGARVVAKISNVHVTSFCESSYKNGYDLDKLRVGAAPEDRTRRERLDAAISAVADCAPERIYYAAVELNGTGVRFYGDMCLVLKDSKRVRLVLDRNSYDLMRSPLCATFTTSNEVELASAVERIAGSWKDDLPAIVALKVLASPRAANRRLTTGQISQGLLADEDYVEVIVDGSFGASELHEVRLQAEDVAKEEYVARRQLTGPMPSAASQLWKTRRWEAEAALAQKHVPVLVVTDSGRVRP